MKGVVGLPNCKLVVTDGHAVQHLLGEEAWITMKGIVGTRNFEYYAYTEPSELLSRAKGATVLVINKTNIDLPVIMALITHGLKAILVTAIGHDCVTEVAKACAREHGVPVMNTRGYCVDDVADMTMLLILTQLRYFTELTTGVRDGKWKGPSFNLIPNAGNYKPQRLRRLTLGFIGTGEIAQAVADRAKPFGLKLIGFDPAFKGRITVNGISMMTKERVLKEADIVSLHCPYSDGPVIGASELAMMKPTAVLINTARGALVDEDALANALLNGDIAGASEDVRATEPLGYCDTLGWLINCTGHNAWYTVQSVEDLMGVVNANLRSILAGKPNPDFTVNGVTAVNWAK